MLSDINHTENDYC